MNTEKSKAIAGMVVCGIFTVYSAFTYGLVTWHGLMFLIDLNSLNQGSFIIVLVPSLVWVLFMMCCCVFAFLGAVGVERNYGRAFLP